MNSARPLEKKAAIVTGASRGIGFAVARKLGELGARVVICARDSSRLQAAATDLGRHGIEALAVPADVRRADDVEAMFQRAELALGPVEIVVNNAGIGFFGQVQEASEETWDSVLDTNLKSVFLMTRVSAPAMIRRRSGHIINIA